MFMLAYWLIVHSLLWHLFVEAGGIKLYGNILLSLIGGAFLLRDEPTLRRCSLAVAGTFLAFLVYSYVVSLISPCDDVVEKPVKALILMISFSVVLLLSIEVGARSKVQDWLALREVAFYIIVFVLASCFTEMAFPSIADKTKLKYHLEGKYAGIFDEPSHLAMSMFPCVIILLSSARKKDIIRGSVSLVILLWIARSATFLQMLILWILYRITIMGYVRQGLKMLGAAVSVVLVASVVNYSAFVYPFVKRVIGVVAPDRSTGLSSLVYLKGWQDAGVNLWRTNGLGLGLNMMGCDPLPETSIRNLFRTVAGRSLATLNDTNGSFLLSKMLSEAGLFGLLAFGATVYIWLRLGLMRKTENRPEWLEMYSIQGSLLFGLILTMLIRGTNYYQGLVFLFSAVFGHYLLNASAKKQ